MLFSYFFCIHWCEMVVIVVNNPDLVFFYLIGLILSNFCQCTYILYSALYIVGAWKKIFKEGWFPELQVITGNNLVLSALVCIVSLGLHSLVVKNKCHTRSRSTLKVLEIIGDKTENYWNHRIIWVLLVFFRDFWRSLKLLPGPEVTHGFLTRLIAAIVCLIFFLI